MKFPKKKENETKKNKIKYDNKINLNLRQHHYLSPDWNTYYYTVLNIVDLPGTGTRTWYLILY